MDEYVRLFDALWIGIISGVAAYYIAKLIDRYFSTWAASRPTQQFWDFLSRDTTIILSAHSRYLGIDYPVWWTSFGDVQSLRDFYIFLCCGFLSLYQRITFKRLPRYPVSFLGSEEDWSQHCFSNMVIIGGPVYNIKTRKLLIDIHRRLIPESQRDICHGDGFWTGRSYKPDESRPTYNSALAELLGNPRSRHAFSDDVFTNQPETTMHQPTRGTDNELQTDYGIAIKCTNPYRPDRRVVIVYGAYDTGTKGAMDYITNHDTLRDLLMAVGRNNDLWVIVEAKVDKRKVVDIRRVERLYTL